jgi:hypothetical protein
MDERGGRAAARWRGHCRSISAALRAAPTELRLRRISALPGNDRLPDEDKRGGRAGLGWWSAAPPEIVRAAVDLVGRDFEIDGELAQRAGSAQPFEAVAMRG